MGQKDAGIGAEEPKGKEPQPELCQKAANEDGTATPRIMASAAQMSTKELAQKEPG
jgi:hypothetical protein